MHDLETLTAPDPIRPEWDSNAATLDTLDDATPKAGATLEKGESFEPGGQFDTLGQSDTVDVWGLRLARVTTDETLDLVDRMIASRRPGLFITANLHYARLTDAEPRLRRLNRRAAFLVADGMPLVWYSRLKRQALPERVTGADAIHGLCRRAAQRGHRVFLLGGTAEVARRAAENLCQLHPGLRIVGVETPLLSELSDADQAALIDRIRSTGVDLLFAALGQPKGELWLAEHLDALGVPACVQIGASLDFVAGRVRRAPRWLQRLGAEWLWRIAHEPRRLVPRYTADAVFLLRAVLRDLFASTK